jgi:hypothetical protein
MRCSGKWISGSGGHRLHEPCNKEAIYWHPDDSFMYCEDHIAPHEIDLYLKLKHK